MANVATIQGTYDDDTPWQAVMGGNGAWQCEDEVILAKLEISYDPDNFGWGPFNGSHQAVQAAARDLDAKIIWGQ